MCRFKLLRAAVFRPTVGFGNQLWNVASQRLPASLCGQLIVSETLFALCYDALWSRAWPDALQLAAAALFTLGILAAIRAHGAH